MERIARGVGRLTNDLLIDRAKGCFVWDSLSGRKYLDFTSGIGVLNIGHCHPRVVRAIQQQASNLMHCQLNIAAHKPMIQLTDKLYSIMPSPSLDTFFFWNSGAEAVEAAIKLARQSTGRQNIIAFQGGYHGRTVGTMSLTSSDTIYKAGFGPLMSGVYFAQFPYKYHAPPGIDLVSHSLHSVDSLLRQQTAPSETAAVIVEPILGEGGYVVPPKGFLSGLKDLCANHGILLILDEVQAGFGRTGKMFACEHFDVTPDILVMAKGIASGMPLSCIASRRELMDKQQPGSMGGTYAGNALSCAAALATIDVLQTEKLLDNCISRGDQLKDRLQALQKRFPDLIGDVRGLGLMVAVEFKSHLNNSNGGWTLSASDDSIRGVAKRVLGECLKRGMLLLKCSTFETIRFIPPLNVSREEIDLGMGIFEEAIEAVALETTSIESQ